MSDEIDELAELLALPVPEPSRSGRRPDPAVTAEHARQALDQIRQQRQALANIDERLRRSLGEWVCAARDLGVGPSEIAVRAGVSRPTVRSILAVDPDTQDG